MLILALTYTHAHAPYYRASLIIAHLFYPLCFVSLEKRRLKTFWKKSKIGRTGKDRIRRHTLAHV